MSRNIKWYFWCNYPNVNEWCSKPKDNNNFWQKCQIGPISSWPALTDVMGQLPKHLIVDTVQWNHNTDLHDGCQIKMNPAMVLPALNSCMGKPVRGERWCGHWLSLFVKILHPSPSLLVWSQSSAVCQLAASTPENLDSTFVDFSQEWMQLDCFVGVKHPFAYIMQSIILMGLNFLREHALIW